MKPHQYRRATLAATPHSLGHHVPPTRASNVYPLQVASLVAPGQQVDVVLGGTIGSELELVGALARDKFNSVMLPTSLASRGVQNPALSYPYRDDATRIWEAVNKYVNDFVRVWYTTDADVT